MTGKWKFSARAGKDKVGARAGKCKLRAKTSNYKLEARARARGQAKGRGLRNTDILKEHLFVIVIH